MMKYNDSRAEDRALFAKEDAAARRRRWRALLWLSLIAASVYGGSVLWSHIWPDPKEATLKTVANTDCQEHLFQIATQSSRDYIIRAAVGKINDEELLTKLALRGDRRMNFPAALKLRQPASLGRVALESTQDMVSRAVILRITDQGLLEKIALNRPAPFALSAALRLTDPAAIHRVFEGTSDWAVRLSAARALNDPILLKTIFAAPDAGSVRFQTLDALKKHPAALAELFLDEKYRHVVKYLYHEGFIRRITDQKMLGLIAHAETLDQRIRSQAVQCITDQETLSSLARSVSNETVQGEAIKRLINQDLLAKLARSDSSVAIRRKAICRLTDVPLLKKLTQDESYPIQEEATRRLRQFILTDDATFVDQFYKSLSDTEDQLAVIALASVRRTEANEATDRIQSQTALLRVALHNNQARRIRAIRRVTDQAGLRKIASNPNTPMEIRIAAMNQITDQKWLMKLFRSPKSRINPFGNASLRHKLGMLRCITDQRLLTEIVIDPELNRKLGDWTIQRTAERVTTPQLARIIAMEAPDLRAQRWGVKYTTDQDTLTELGWRHLDSSLLTGVIAPKLTDRELLLAIAIKHLTHRVISPAEIRLAELNRIAEAKRPNPTPAPQETPTP
jgi:hypothetical protein